MLQEKSTYPHQFFNSISINIVIFLLKLNSAYSFIDHDLELHIPGRRRISLRVRLDGWSSAMQMNRARQLDYRQSSFCYEESFLDRENNYRRSPPPPLLTSTTFTAGGSFIEHHVSKFDTLAGIAIKYGVEVADIRKINGLASDIQIFALKSIQIPLPGRHPPSPCFSLSDASTPVVSPSSLSQKTSLDSSSDFLDSFQPSKPRASSTHKLSAAMSSLQSYYGLQSDGQKPTGSSGGSTTDVSATCSSCPPRKSRSIDDDSGGGTAEVGGDHPDIHAVRRRQKSEADVSSGNSKMMTELVILREENNATSGSAFSSTITGKCLALRSNTKLTSSDDVQTDFDEMSSLQDQESSGLASLWAASKWPDLQVLTTAAIARPIFDGIQKPVNIWRNKTAVD